MPTVYAPTLLQTSRHSQRRMVSLLAWIMRTPNVDAAMVLIHLLYPSFRLRKNKNRLPPVANARTLLESDTKK